MEQLCFNMIEEAPKMAARIVAGYLIERSSNSVTAGAMERFLSGTHSMEGSFASAIFRADFEHALKIADSGNRACLNAFLLKREQYIALCKTQWAKNEDAVFYGVTFSPPVQQNCGRQVQRDSVHESSAKYNWRMMFGAFGEKFRSNAVLQLS